VSATLAGRETRSAIALATLVAAAILPGLLRLPPVDRDEARFARGARETLALPAAERLLPRLDGRARLDKPPLSAWAQAAAVSLAGDAGARSPSIAPHRLPSLLAAIAAALATWRLGRRFLSRRAAWLAGLLFAITPLVIWEGAQARTDMLLVAATTGALAAFAPALLSVPGARLSLGRATAGWTAVGLALLAKGPIALLVVLPPLLFTAPRGERRRTWRATRPALGVAIVALLLAPWLVALARQGLASDLAATVFRELPGRALSPREGHGAFPGFHLLLAPLLYWPASLLLPLGAIALYRRFRSGDAAARLLLLWIVPAWIVFELAATRLPHYTLPLAPALALLAAETLEAAETATPSSFLSQSRALRALAGIWRWGTLVVPPALLLVLAWPLGTTARALAFLFAGAALVAHLATQSAWRARRPLRPLLGALAVAAAGAALAVGVLLPARRELWLGPRLAAEALRLDPAAERPLAAGGWCEESVIFATGGRLERIPAEAGGDWLERHPDGLLIHEGNLPAATAVALAEVAGFDYVRGIPRRITISTAAAR
jgi:4-amino-4-deoxy-L-arabinose transferase-like glycosyltransferase